jgi:hypothetical protein
MDPGTRVSKRVPGFGYSFGYPGTRSEHYLSTTKIFDCLSKSIAFITKFYMNYITFDLQFHVTVCDADC